MLAAVFGMLLRDRNVVSAVFSIRLFTATHTVLLVAIWMVGPVLTADAISRERREGTLSLLFGPIFRRDRLSWAKASCTWRAGHAVAGGLPCSDGGSVARRGDKARRAQRLRDRVLRWALGARGGTGRLFVRPESHRRRAACRDKRGRTRPSSVGVLGWTWIYQLSFMPITAVSLTIPADLRQIAFLLLTVKAAKWAGARPVRSGGG